MVQLDNKQNVSERGENSKFPQTNKKRYREEDPEGDILEESAKVEKRKRLENSLVKNQGPMQKVRQRTNRDQQPQTEKRKGICNYFVNGACHKGNLCIFSHEAPVKREKTVLCKYFTTGNCHKGDDCTFSHITQDFPCKYFHACGYCDKGDDCNYSHERLSPEGIRRFLEQNEEFIIQVYKSCGKTNMDDFFFQHISNKFQQDAHTYLEGVKVPKATMIPSSMSQTNLNSPQIINLNFQKKFPNPINQMNQMNPQTMQQNINLPMFNNPNNQFLRGNYNPQMINMNMIKPLINPHMLSQMNMINSMVRASPLPQNMNMMNNMNSITHSMNQGHMGGNINMQNMQIQQNSFSRASINNIPFSSIIGNKVVNPFQKPIESSINNTSKIDEKTQSTNEELSQNSPNKEEKKTAKGIYFLIGLYSVKKFSRRGR
jgi:hypothetical protein